MIIFYFRHKKKVAMFVPESSSRFQQVINWFFSRRPEYYNQAMLASGEGREGMYRMFNKHRGQVRGPTECFTK